VIPLTVDWLVEGKCAELPIRRFRAFPLSPNGQDARSGHEGNRRREKHLPVAANKLTQRVDEIDIDFDLSTQDDRAESLELLGLGDFDGDGQPEKGRTGLLRLDPPSPFVERLTTYELALGGKRDNVEVGTQQLHYHCVGHRQLLLNGLTGASQTLGEIGDFISGNPHLDSLGLPKPHLARGVVENPALL